MKDLLLSSALAAISLALFTTGAAQADTAHQSFDVEPGDRLIVDTEWGAIKVHTWAVSYTHLTLPTIYSV